MMAYLLQIIVGLASLVIFLYSEPVVNRMSKTTPLCLRGAYSVLTIAAVLNIGALLFMSWMPSPTTALFSIGTALLLHSERRWHWKK